MFHDKDIYMNREKKDISTAREWFKSRIPNVEILTYMIAGTEHQNKGIDFILNTSVGVKYLENKTRYKDYNNFADILLETISNDKKDSIGWMGYPNREGYCEADYFAYGWQISNNPYVGHIIDFELLKRWWKTQDINDFIEKSARNKDYLTLNRIVPIHKMPKNIFLYSDVPNMELI